MADTTQAVTAERNWGAEEWRAPALADGDTLMFSECGRIVERETYGHGRNGIDYRSHYFRVVKAEYGGCSLLVKHGAGEERIALDYNAQRVAILFAPLDSTERYLLCHMLYEVARRGQKAGEQSAKDRYERAFRDGTLKKRKIRGTESYKVWIDR